MLSRLVKPRSLALIGGTGVGIGYLVNNNEYVSHLGIVRFARAGLTASKMIVDYKITMRGDPGSEEYQQRMHLCHLRGANRILELCRNNGGVFIKVGQHVASLQYLLPEEYISVLGVLHSKAPSSDIIEIKKVFVDTTGRELEDVFEYFNPEPCGAASLAQVHEARLKSGERVAVKIQHPKVRDRSVMDVATMELFARIADYLFSDFKLMWLVDETKKNLPKELDFIHEAKNAEKVRELFKHMDFLEVPKIYLDLCSEKVLTMQFCEGCQISDVDYFRTNNIDTHDVCRKIGRLYSEMIFKDGYVHCDPHPGNIMDFIR
ncbi:unnamed protein product [Bursaphelenchus xylophilus]|uniref:(pine wood nematode) hypothetical protein n=1 Tax=Bursaphelenchus xylophilus TaxID=6326 RepID=A0A1I7RSQ8_BURXY|nr:unnamed protein product [Bursaphelenchus xylophilus]CAG9122834.1 unnamed protein product [Bursaphelenchus xylophilus]